MLGRTARAGNLDIALTEVHIVGQKEFEIERAESIKICRAFGDFVAARIFNRISNRAADIAERLDIAELCPP
jgi:hypothetical protein